MKCILVSVMTLYIAVSIQRVATDSLFAKCEGPLAVQCMQDIQPKCMLGCEQASARVAFCVDSDAKYESRPGDLNPVLHIIAQRRNLIVKKCANKKPLELARCGENDAW